MRYLLLRAVGDTPCDFGDQKAPQIHASKTDVEAAFAVLSKENEYDWMLFELFEGRFVQCSVTFHQYDDEAILINEINRTGR